jgi:Protein of unknown function (DUF3489)
MTDVQEKSTTSEGTEATPEPVLAKRPRVAPHARRVAAPTGKPPKKATRAGKAHSGASSAKSPKKGNSARQGSKTAKCMALLKRPGGATGAELMKATGWQAHSVRGFISGVLGRRMGLKVSSAADGGQRRYSLKG